MLVSELTGLDLIDIEFILKGEMQRCSELYLSYKNRFGEGSEITKVAKMDVERVINLIEKIHKTSKYIRESE